MNKYDFSHWGGNLPKVSCQCITYGRPKLLEEAIESFLRQDYPGEKELIILNDHPSMRMYLDFDLPNVKIVNKPQRYATVGEKRNACCKMCTGHIIFPWDDDDISLSWRMSITIQEMKNFHHFKPERYIKLKGKEIYSIQANVAHAMGAFSKEAWRKTGGYKNMQSGQDQDMEGRLKKTGLREVHKISSNDLFYIYRWSGTGSYHLSAAGWNHGESKAEAYVNKHVTLGDHIIEPSWRLNYDQLYTDFLKTPKGQRIAEASLKPKPKRSGAALKTKLTNTASVRARNAIRAIRR